MIAPSLSTFRIKPQISTYSLSDDVTQDIEEIPGKLWIDKIHTAFDEIDIDQKGFLNMAQFKVSRLRFLITGTRLNDMQMENYFRQIDSNGENQITFQELIDFLMSLQRSLTSVNIEKTLKITFEGPDERFTSKYSRTMVCIRSFYVPPLDEICVLCDTALIFYSFEDAKPVQTFTDKDLFVDAVYMPTLHKIAICKQNREIIFFDVRGRDKVSFTISATLNTNFVSKMSVKESRKASQWCHQAELPLYNRSTAIQSNPKQPFLFVGDDKGGIEIFYVYMNTVDGKSVWSYERIMRQVIHTSEITQITYIPSIKSYLSSSMDGSIVLWKFNMKKRVLTIECSHQNSMKLAIRLFTYDERTHDVIYTTTAHCFCIWRTYTSSQTTIETHNQIVQTMNIYQMAREQSFLITLSRSGFFTIYRMPGLEVVSNWFMGLMHENCPPTRSTIVDQKLFLAGAFLSMWRLENGNGDGLRPHSDPIISAFTNDIFNSVISLDNAGNVINWNYTTGRKENWYTLMEPDTLVECVALDMGQRRMALGYTDGRVKIVSANSGSVLNEISNEYIEGGCHHITFGTIFDQKRILCCTGVKSVVLFEDYSGSRIRFVRSFIGHTENVNSTVILKGEKVLSIGIEHEMFLWRVQSQNPILRYQMPNDPTVAVDLKTDGDHFLVGDVIGFIYFMSLDSPTPVSTINAFHMSIKSPITCMEMCDGYPLLVASNMHGYVKYWFFLGDRLEDLRQFRAHTEMVLSVSISQKMRIVVTSGKDEQIRMWSVEPMGIIGSFGRGKLWKINHLDMWESEYPLEDDPVHFAQPEDLQVQEKEMTTKEEEEVNEANEEEEKKEKFDYHTVEEIYNTTEKLYETGEKINKKASILIKEPPLSARRPPLKPLITFDSYMENRDMEGTIKRINNILRPKITKPIPQGKS